MFKCVKQLPYFRSTDTKNVIFDCVAQPCIGTNEKTYILGTSVMDEVLVNEYSGSKTTPSWTEYGEGVTRNSHPVWGAPRCHDDAHRTTSLRLSSRDPKLLYEKSRRFARVKCLADWFSADF